ncbi:MAG: oligosaccharide repeat unit polymerase [Ignavibacteriales bacterium]|nr:oligosaccharide repeat unit polymerase [Ignavibacteriales bacterium]
MSNFFILIVIIIAIGISKYFFQRWFNPLLIYSIVWGSMLSAYELKLMPFINLSFDTWIIIIGSYLAFFLGVAICFTTKGVNFNINYRTINSKKSDFIFFNNNKFFNRIIWSLALIGLFAAIHHWWVLLEEYGSFTKIIFHAARIYRQRADGLDDNSIPYLWLGSYLAVFYAGISNAKKGKIEFVTIIAILGIILKEMARFVRSGILVGMLLYITSYIYFRYSVAADSLGKNKKSNRKIIIGAFIVISILVAAAGFVKVSRNAPDNFSGTSSSLTQFDGGAFISPSIYLYLSSHVAVLSRSITMEEKNTYWAQNTFRELYTILGIFGLHEKIGYDMPGYYIPYWTNSGSYLRDLYRDFGPLGIIWFPFFVGLFASFFWIKFYESNDIYYFLGLVNLTIVIGMSFFSYMIKSVLLSINLFFHIIIIEFSYLLYRKFTNRNQDDL